MASADVDKEASEYPGCCTFCFLRPATQDEECDEAPLPPVHVRPDLQSCCSDIDAVNNVWMVAYF